MNLYPSWIHRIPEVLEALHLHPDERIDRRAVEALFDLRKTAAFHLLRRLGAARCGNALLISRGQLLAGPCTNCVNIPAGAGSGNAANRCAPVLRICAQAEEPRWAAIDATLQQQIDQLATAGLPDSIQLAPGYLTIRCTSMEHLLKQLVLVAKALDADYEAVRYRIEGPIAKPPGRETRSDGRPPRALAPGSVRP